MPEKLARKAGISGFLMCKCPRCGVDRVFRYPIFILTKFSDTKESCSSCGLTYIPEPGFFFGAMYWSYAMLVALIVTLSILFSYFGKLETAIFWIPLIIIALLPFIFRYSRMLMLYVVYPVMYKEKFRKKDD